MKPFANSIEEIVSYIDITKRVRVYKNLHKNCLSIQQNGIVKCHARTILLKDIKCIVNAAGQKRVREQKRKNVHAFIEGFLCRYICDEFDANLPKLKRLKIKYNPYQTDFWVDKNNNLIESGMFALIDDEVFVYSC